MFDFRVRAAGLLRSFVVCLDEENEIRFDVELPFCCGGGIPLAQAFMQPDRGVSTEAVFAQFDYALTERANITVGYRHTWDEKYDRGGSNHQTIGYWDNPGAYDPAGSFWYESWGLIGVDPTWASNPAFYQADKLTPEMGSLAEDFTTRVPGADNTYQADWANGTWRLGFDYLISNDLFAYGYVASGFKAGGFGDKVDVCECGEITAFPYDPEEAITFELGLKGEALDGNLRLLANVFFNNYTDGPFHAGQKAVSSFNANFRIINEDQAWALVFFGNNLSDELLRSWADPGPGYWRANFFPPRTYGVRFSKGF